MSITSCVHRSAAEVRASARWSGCGTKLERNASHAMVRAVIIVAEAINAAYGETGAWIRSTPDRRRLPGSSATMKQASASSPTAAATP